MKYFNTLLLIIFSPLLFFGQSHFEGKWKGTLDAKVMTLDMNIELIKEGDKWKGSLDIPKQNIFKMALDQLEIVDDSLYFSLPEVPGNAKYEAALVNGDQIVGSFYQAGQQLDLSFNKLDERTLAKYKIAADRISFLADSLMPIRHISGMGVGIIKDGEIIMSQGFGFGDFENKVPVNENTVFAIGSSTKAFVAAGIAKLASRNIINWDEPIKTYLPDFKLHDEFASEQMNAIDLLSHRSGLPRHDFMWYGADATRQELYSKLHHLKSTEPFRTKFQYQNLMYMTGGILIEKMSGMTWEEYTKKEIFAPLGMTNTNLSVEDSKKLENKAFPYQEKEDKIVKMDFRNLDAIGPAGSINSSVKDMLQWVKFQLNRGNFDGNEILAGDQFDIMHEPQTIIGSTAPGSISTDELSTHMYGTGWFITHYKGTKIVHHGGNIDGFSALVFLVPSEQLGMVFLTNKNGARLPMPLAFEATDLLTEIEPSGWIAKAFPKEVKEDVTDEDELKGEDPQIKNTRPSFTLDKYVGVYDNEGYGQIEVSLTNKKLNVHYNGMTWPLTHYHFDVFKAMMEDIGQESLVQFFMDGSASIQELSTLMEPSLPAMKFIKRPPSQLEDQAFIDIISGQYTLGPQNISIKVKGDYIKMKITGQPEYDLVSYKEDEFKIKNLDGYSIKFFFDKNRKAVKHMTFYQPNGTFKAEPVELTGN